MPDTGFAKAFKRDIGKEDELAKEQWPATTYSTVLMNDARRKIFLYLCSHPASHLRAIAKRQGMSATTASWHLRKLVSGGFIVKQNITKKSVFYPTGLLDQEEVELFALLSTDGYHEIFSYILAHPGLHQKSLSEAMGVAHQNVMFLVKRLLDIGLVSKLNDGKFRRYYPTDLMSKKADESRVRKKQFRMDALTMLKRDGLRPKLVRRTDNYLLVDISVGANVERIKVETNPYVSVLNE